MKTNSNGKEAWSKTFSGLGIAGGSSVRQTSDGGYIVVGGTYPPGGKGQLYLLKTDSNGKETWSKTFSVLNEASGGSVQQTVDRGYIVAGYTRSSPYTSWQIYLIKTDENGILSWERKFEGLGFARGFSVRQTSDRGFIVAGETDRPLNGEKMKIYLVKLEPPYYYYYKQPSFANLVGSIDFNPSLLLMGRVNRSLKNR